MVSPVLRWATLKLWSLISDYSLRRTLTWTISSFGYIVTECEMANRAMSVDGKHYSHKLCQPDNIIVSANKLIFRHFPNCHLLCSYCSWSRLRLPTTHRPLFAVSLYIILIVRPQQNQFVPPIHWVIVLNGKNTQSDSRSVIRVPQVHSFRCLLFKQSINCRAPQPHHSP